jgi:DNA-directed RNA polymerase specialized sigma24 family protein
MTTKELFTETTVNLLDYISSGNADPSYKELGDTAFAVFVDRFRKDLVDKCVVLCRKWKKPDDYAEDLVMTVFDRYYKYPRYKQEECRSGVTDECIRRYLYGIANTEIFKLFCPSYSPYDGSEKIVISLVDPEKDYDPETLKELQEREAQLDKIFDKLTPKHKIIFLTYKQYEEGGHNLPRKLLAELRKVLNLTQTTIRVYKKEAIELVEKELSHAR